MKTRMLVSTLILVLAVLIIIGGCATTPKTKKGREVVNQELFFKSVRSGDYAEVKRLIEEGADVNAQDKYGLTVLIYVSQYGHTEVAKLLIDAGADVNAQDNFGGTALMWASFYGYTDIEKLLVEADAIVSKKTNAVTFDFDRKMPDDLYTRKGAHLEIVYDPLINDTRMGLIIVPSGVTGVKRSLRPYGSFSVDCLGKLRNTITSFRTYVSVKLPYESRSPYIVYAVTVDDDPRPEAYVVGRRIVGSEIAGRPEEECPVETWFECRLDMDTLVHVADFRENLGNNFTTWNYGTLANLVKTPLRDEMVWGDLDIVFVEIGAGAWGGPPFEAYVDDINVVSGP